MPERRTFCSEESRANAEPLAATASRVDHWLLVEYRGLWAHDALPGSGLSDQVKAHLREQAAARPRTKLLFVRRTERRGRPGLAIRCPGAITGEKLDVLRKADAIYLDEIRKAGLYDKIWQAFAVLLPVKTVGVMGDGRTYEYVVALSAVETSDFMTAGWAPLPHELLAKVSSRIINEVRGINRVTYDISSKPPATIEWE